MTGDATYRDIMDRLVENDYQAFLVGGAVRDAYLNRPVKDYDIVTDATPKQVIDLFDGASIISAAFSVSVHVPSSEAGGVVEVVTMRREDDADYVNGKPSVFKFTKNIHEDLARRDATINAIAMDHNGNIIDPHSGREHLDARKIVAIGNPEDRIKAHPIRMLRYARFATCLGDIFTMDNLLVDAIIKNRILIVRESWDAIGAEFMKGLNGNSQKYILTLRHLGLLEVLLPEVFALHGVEQNAYHGFEDVWSHTLRCLGEADALGYHNLNKLAVLLHDIGKPQTRAFKSQDYGATFYQHESVGATIARSVAERLRCSEEHCLLIYLAVKNHMYTVDSAKTARRYLSRMDVGGNSDIEELKRRVSFTFLVRMADIKKGFDNNAARHERVAFDLIMAELDKKSPFRVTDLNINGNKVMEVLGIKEGVEVGWALNYLLGLVIDGALENNEEALVKSVKGWYAELSKDRLLGEKKAEDGKEATNNDSQKSRQIPV